MKPGFTALGGTLAINFGNTVQRHRGTVYECLVSPLDVNVWLEYMVSHNQLTQEQYRSITSIPMTSNDLVLLKNFRTAGRDYLASAMAEIEFIKDVQHAAAMSPATMDLYRVNGTYHSMMVPINGGIRGLLALLAFDWIQLWTEGVMERVKGCANTSCLAYFVDASGRRKWCSMDGCGNRIKNERYHQRNRRKEHSEDAVFSDQDKKAP